MNFSPISITFFAYLVVMVAVGLVAWRFTKNFNDYILGGRRLGAVVTALSVGASDMSGWAFQARFFYPESANPGLLSVWHSVHWLTG